MAKTITFVFKPDKFVNAVAYFALRCPDVTKLKVCKLLFYADKEHLLRYGRPIVGDRYYQLPYGPIPTRGLDILRGKSLPAEEALLEKYVSVVDAKIFPKRNPDKKVFSKSDLEIMEDICSRYGHLSANQLMRLSHKEPSYIKANPSGSMDYLLFFEGRPDLDAIKHLVEAEQETRDVLGRFRAEK